MTWSKIVLEPPTLPVSGESRYLTPLWVSRNVEPQEEIKYKIRAALKLLFFREQHVIVQFWSSRSVGKHLLLTTNDQPFGVGVANEELCIYRKDSEHNVFHVDMDHQEKDLSPPARVFMRELPEWTSDLTNYNTKDFPQQDCAIRCNLHGYLALPVFDSTTGLCVGVLELLTSSKLKDFAYEVGHIHRELQIWNLTSPQVFGGPPSNVLNERSRKDLDKIFGILKVVCGTHNLPLAQTWTVSKSASCFAHENVLEKTCSSFNTRCLGKVCISTALPCYVRDLRAWSFMKASKERHLELSRGAAGRALSSRGSCFCGDITKLDEEEYPLVHNARMSGLKGCFSIFLHSVECHDDYVLEFFLKDSRHVLNVAQTLKHSVKAAFGFELGDGSSLELGDGSSDSESMVTDAFEPDYGSSNDNIEELCDKFTLEKSNLMKQDRKRKRDLDTVLSAMVNVTFNKSVEQFRFPLFHGLSKLKNEVAKRFKLEGQSLRLKYVDDDDDLILICRDDDLKSALDASDSMNLICLEG